MLGVEIAGLRVDELAALLLGGLRRIIFAATTGTLSPSGLRLRRSCLPGPAVAGRVSGVLLPPLA
jgi:hypothetical protein